MTDNYSQSKKHPPLAIEITRERVALLNKRSKGRTSFTITETFPNAAERKGVKVIFVLPLS